MKGPAIFLAQFIDDTAPFNTLEGLCHWAAKLGYKGIQLPTWDKSIFNLKLAVESIDYCNEIKSIVSDSGLTITELSTHLQGQLLATHPAYAPLFVGFADEQVRGNNEARRAWAHQQLLDAAKASQRLGVETHATFSGALMWHLFYPWPQRPKGLIEDGFKELAKRWLPILNTFDDNGVDVAFELHPGEDLFDGVTFERFLEAVGNHARANILYDPSHFLIQKLDYLSFIDIYHERIKAFHVKDAEFISSGRSGVYGGYSDWKDRPGRFRSVGDGQVDFKQIFSRFCQYGYDGWAVLEWECCFKDSNIGAQEGAPFIQSHIIQTGTKAFDDFTAAKHSQEKNNLILGIK